MERSESCTVVVVDIQYTVCISQLNHLTCPLPSHGALAVDWPPHPTNQLFSQDRKINKRGGGRTAGGKHVFPTISPICI